MGPKQQVVGVALTNESQSNEPQQAPFIEVLCENAVEGTGWLAGSTYDSSTSAAPGRTTKGDLSLLPPGNTRTGEPIQKC